MATRVNLHPIFILHTKSYRDTSLLLDVITLEHGRIQMIARSARGPRSRFKGLLQPFTPFLASWSGKSELMSLSQVEADGAPYFLSGNALLSGFYLNELLTRLLHRHDSQANIYVAYQQALTCLQHNENPERVLRLFENQLLTELGYGLQLDKEAIAETAIVAEQFYRYDLDYGLVRCEEMPQRPLVFRGKNLLALHHNNLEDLEDLQAAKRLMRLVLAPLLGNKPLKTRELFGKF